MTKLQMASHGPFNIPSIGLYPLDDLAVFHAANGGKK
jgi:hypothetical protein